MCVRAGSPTSEETLFSLLAFLGQSLRNCVCVCAQADADLGSGSGGGGGGAA